MSSTAAVISIDKKPMPVDVLPQEPEAARKHISDMGLKNLILHRQALESQLAAQDGEISSEMEEVFQVAAELTANKIDRIAAMIKVVIPSHIAACKDQIAKLVWLEDKIKTMTIEAIQMLGKDDKGETITQLNGLAWRARTQANPPAIEILDPDAIPLMFKKAKMTITVSFDPSNTKASKFWESGLEAIKEQALKHGYGDVVGDIEVMPDNEQIRESVLDKKDGKKIIQAGVPVDGVKVRQGVHVRFESGKAKAATQKTTKGSKKEASDD